MKALKKKSWAIRECWIDDSGRSKRKGSEMSDFRDLRSKWGIWGHPEQISGLGGRFLGFLRFFIDFEAKKEDFSGFCVTIKHQKNRDILITNSNLWILSFFPIFNFFVNFCVFLIFLIFLCFFENGYVRVLILDFLHFSNIWKRQFPEKGLKHVMNPMQSGKNGQKWGFLGVFRGFLAILEI